MLWHAVDMLRCSVVPAHARAPVATAPACVASRRARGCRAAQQARRRGARQQTGSPPRGCHPGRPRPSPHMLTCCVAVLYARPAKAQAGIQAGRNSLLGFCRTHLFAPTLPLLRSTAAASAARGAAAAGAAEEGARGLTCWKARVEASLGSPTPSARCLSTCPPPPPPSSSSRRAHLLSPALRRLLLPAGRTACPTAARAAGAATGGPTPPASCTTCRPAQKQKQEGKGVPMGVG